MPGEQTNVRDVSPLIIPQEVFWQHSRTIYTRGCWSEILHYHVTKRYVNHLQELRYPHI